MSYSGLLDAGLDSLDESIGVYGHAKTGRLVAAGSLLALLWLVSQRSDSTPEAPSEVPVYTEPEKEKELIDATRPENLVWEPVPQPSDWWTTGLQIGAAAAAVGNLGAMAHTLRKQKGNSSKTADDVPSKFLCKSQLIDAVDHLENTLIPWINDENTVKERFIESSLSKIYPKDFREEMKENWISFFKGESLLPTRHRVFTQSWTEHRSALERLRMMLEKLKAEGRIWFCEDERSKLNRAFIHLIDHEIEWIQSLPEWLEQNLKKETDFKKDS